MTLLARVMEARERVSEPPATTRCSSRSRPISTLAELDDIVRRALAPGRRHDRREHDGGASGDTARRPIARRSPAGSRAVRCCACHPHRGGDLCAGRGRFPPDRRGRHRFRGARSRRIRAGAILIALYSALVYKDLRLLEDIKRDLSSNCSRAGHESRRRSSAPMPPRSQPRSGRFRYKSPRPALVRRSPPSGEGGNEVGIAQQSG